MHYSAKRGLEIACRLCVRLSVCPSVCLSVCDVDGSWPHRLKILETNCANNWPNIFAFRSPKVIYLLPGNMEKFWGENVRSAPTSITSGLIESTESHMILGGGVAVCCFCVCLLLSAHRAIIFATVQLSCLLYTYQNHLIVPNLITKLNGSFPTVFCVVHCFPSFKVNPITDFVVLIWGLHIFTSYCTFVDHLLHLCISRNHERSIGNISTFHSIV